MKTIRAAGATAMAALLFTNATYACPKATVTGAYADLCRDFTTT